MRRLTVGLASLIVLCSVAVEAQQIGFIEKFALAEDRSEALKLLIPGSQDYYYFHCLHYQNTEQFDRVEELLKAWIKRYNYTPAVHEIQNRQALLTYQDDPESSLEFIRGRLGIQFNHQRDTIGEKPNLPTILEQALISRERLTQIAKQRHKNLAGFEDAALDWLIVTELNPDRRRHLLQRLQRYQALFRNGKTHKRASEGAQICSAAKMRSIMPHMPFLQNQNKLSVAWMKGQHNIYV